MGMVELEQVHTLDDQRTLRTMLESHLKYTGSRKAKSVLDNWKSTLRKFLKIMPIDYKRVLAERKASALKEQAKEMVGHG